MSIAANFRSDPSYANSTAFEAARAICRLHAKSFYFASKFLPKDKRYAAYAVYAFCRLLDDATDEAIDPAGVERQIERFVAILDQVYQGAGIDGASGEPALQAFAATVHRYGILQSCFVEIADGCRMDLTITRYETWEDLRQYCYRVAGVVGVIMCRIFGLADPSAEAQAILMGEAMQLTNILRDIKEDAGRGRIYLPLEDLRRFDYSEQDLLAGVVNEPFVRLMQFQIDRARSLYRAGAGGLHHLADDGSRFTATAMGVIYAGILNAIERQRYDVFSARRD